jgi:hypothetical protein
MSTAWVGAAFHLTDEVIGAEWNLWSTEVHRSVVCIFQEQLAQATFCFYENKICFRPAIYWTNPTDIPR